MTGNTAGSIRVLYVEDDKTLQLIVSQMLGMLGYEVAFADNGRLGVEKARSWKPDVILMDVRMPVMDGSEATRILRADPDTAQIPIFVLSAYTDAKTRKLCAEAGADGFFAKPPAVDKIDSAIKKALSTKPRGG